MKRWILILLGALCMATANAQQSKSRKAAEKAAEKIRNDQNYLYGIGEDADYKKAQDFALADLMRRISINLSQAFSISERAEDRAQGHEESATMESVIKTYTQGTLTRTQKIDLQTEPPYKVMCYIAKSEVDKIFKEREERVMQYVRDANAAEAKGKVGDALRQYYWALCLLSSLPHPTEVKWDDGGQTHILDTWVSNRINYIFDNLTAKIAKVEGNQMDLLITYKGEPVTEMDITYHDGLSRSNLYGVKNGLVKIEMRPDMPTQDVELHYEYEYDGQARLDKEVEPVVKNRHLPFKKAMAMVACGKKSEMKQTNRTLQQVVANQGAVAHVAEEKGTDAYAKVMNEVLTAIKGKRYEQVKKHFTNEGYDMFDTLLHYGNATLIGTAKFSFYPMQGKMVCRSVPMRFTFRNNNRAFVEDVTFTFNKERKIESLAFALDKAAKDDIFNKAPGAWNDSVRMIIATFLENYKTAFALKRLDYIRSIFADNAVIITGHMLKRATKPRMENEKLIESKEVKYTIQDKNTYLKNLENSFKSKEFINIRFVDNDVEKLGKEYGEMYGIQIRQDYYSSNYCDTGYLFLMVNFNDMEAPQIIVRTWQPQRDPNINNLNKNDRYYGLINAANF